MKARESSGPMMAMFMLSAFLAVGGGATANAAVNNWMFPAKWGVFMQYINNGENLADWNTRVNNFDVAAYADQVAAAKIGYVIVMLQQGSDYSCSPNPYTPYASTRDLPMDLFEALNAKGIKMMLYQAVDRDRTMVLNAVRYYSNKYGTKAAGWFFDGFGPNNEAYMDQLNAAARSGNPDTMIGFGYNPGYGNGHGEDFAQFEAYDLLDAVHRVFPNGGTINGEQAVATSYISQWYGRDGQEPHWPDHDQSQTGPRYSDEQIISSVSDYISAGGVLIIDVPVDYSTGIIFPSYISQLNALGDAISKISVRNAPEPMQALIDNDDSRVSYSGTWSINESTLPSANYNRRAKQSNIPGDFVQFSFYGDAISFLSRVWDEMGKADVYIDGVWDRTIDLYSSREYYQKVVYSRTGLPLENHTIRVVVKGDKSPSATDYFVNIDAFEPRSDRIEAENTRLSGGAKSQGSADASNGRDVGFMSAVGSGVQFTNYAASNTLKIRYSTIISGTFSLYINGVKNQAVSFQSTGSWTAYADKTVNVAIPAGAVVKLSNDAGDVPINIDYISAPSRRIEAESAALSGGAQAQSAAGASNGRDVGYMTATGDGVQFTNFAAASILGIRYSTIYDGTFSLYVNGTKAAAVSLASTGSWTTYADKFVPVTIPAGATVKLQKDAGDVPINVDYISAAFEAESAMLAVGARAQSSASASNGEDVGYMTAVGSSVQFGNLAGSGTLTIRYSATNNGTFSLYVNGVKKQAISFASTGSWTTYADKAVSIAIPAGAVVKLQKDAGDIPINVDYVVQ